MTTPNTNLQVIVLYDGWCSLCVKSMEKFRRFDGDNRRLKLIDFRENDMLIELHDLDPAQVRRLIHSIGSDGTVHTGLNAISMIMKAVGRGWMVSWTRVFFFRWCTDCLYLWFADRRLRWFNNHKCKNDHCSITVNDSKNLHGGQ